MSASNGSDVDQIVDAAERILNSWCTVIITHGPIDFVTRANVRRETMNFAIDSIHTTPCTFSFTDYSVTLVMGPPDAEKALRMFEDSLKQWRTPGWEIALSNGPI